MTEEAAKEAAKQAILAELTDDLQELDKVVASARVGIAGDHGVGKTVLTMQIAQAVTPPDKEILFIDFLDGFMVLRNSIHKHLMRRTRRIQYRSYDQLEKLAMVIEAKVPPFDKVGAVVMDEVSSMQDDDMTVVMRNIAPEKNAPEWPEFNVEKNRFARVYNTFNKLSIHTLYVTHLRKAKNPKGADVMAPALQPILIPIYARPLHVSAMLSADINEKDGQAEYTRTVQVHPTKLAWGFKTRIQDLPVVMKPESLVTAVAEFVKGDRTAEDEKNWREDEEKELPDEVAKTRVTNPNDDLMIEIG